MPEMNIQQILRYLPHRYPFLLVDRVLDFQPGQSISAIKNISVNEPFFSGHFPGQPVMPGVLILEALAQACGILVYISEGHTPADGTMFYFAAIDGARFKRVVYPGDQLHLAIDSVKSKRGIYKVNAVASVEQQTVCVAELMFAKQEQNRD